MLEVAVSEPKKVGRWVMQWIAAAGVLGPKELGKWIMEEVKRMVKQYKERGSEVGIEKMERVGAGQSN